MNFVSPESADKRDDGGEYQRILDKINQGGECPFCEENLQHIHPEPIIQKTAHWILTTNAYPYRGAEHHFLLIHRGHVGSIEELDARAWTDLQLAYASLVERYRLLGATLLLRSGEMKFTGGSVSHLHAQVVSGYGEKDGEPVLARVG